MSTFTRFSEIQQLQFNKGLSLKYKKDLWSLIPGFRYYVGFENSNEYINVPTGFITDGATIPRVLWWLLPPIGEYSQATTLHDYLCRVYSVTVTVNGVEVEKTITRKQIDKILDESLGVLEVTPWKRKAIMAGVNLYRILFNPVKPGKVNEYE